MSVNIIPELQASSTEDYDPSFEPVNRVKNINTKLCKVRANLMETYHTEFLGKLIVQATDQVDRYVPVQHQELRVGDIVLIKDPHVKPFNLPMGRVKKIFKNEIDEVTHVEVFKGATGQVTKRHVSCLVPLLSSLDDNQCTSAVDEVDESQDPDNVKRPLRKAAELSRLKSRSMLNN